MDVFKNVFLGLFNQFENVTLIIVPVDNGRTLGGQKDRTSELDGFRAEKKRGSSLRLTFFIFTLNFL